MDSDVIKYNCIRYLRFLPVERCPRSVEISIQHKKDAHQGPCYRATQLQDGGENATCELKV